jgi:hypothetical protein
VWFFAPHMRALARLICLLSCLALGPAFAADPASYANQLIDQARVKALSSSPEWRALLHYRSNLIAAGVTSEVDAPDFFLAADGKTDPEAELEATLRAFFKPPPSSPDREPTQCRYIARYHWLKRELKFDPRRLPEQRCKEFDDWITALDPQTVTLIFPTAYLNNPSSMFGHTLLRIDAKGQGDQTRLLAYALNYAAVTGNDGGVLFAVKGIFGWYPGLFSIAPYYIRVRQYNDIENRDIWEYELNFSTAEIRFMLMHVWELRHDYFDYFFFDENCSYHLLGLLDVARPSLELTRQFHGWVIPSETVRALVKRGDLVRRVVYRPSRRTALAYRMDQLDVTQRATVVRLANGTMKPGELARDGMSVAERANLLEIAFELLNYKTVTRQIDKKTSDTIGYRLLADRSALDYRATETVTPPPAARPDQGHRPARIAVDYGREDGRWYQDIRLRPAYHDLLDPPGGYVPGAQIRFLDFTLSHIAGTGTVRLENAAVVDIVSLTPVSAMKSSISWKINTGLMRHHLTRADNPLVVHTNGGAGLTWAPVKHALLSAMLEASLDAGDGLHAGYALGMGPSLVWLTDLSHLGRAMAAAKVIRFGLGDVHTRMETSLKYRVPLSRATALDIHFNRVSEFGRGWNDAGAGLHYYF